MSETLGNLAALFVAAIQHLTMGAFLLYLFVGIAIAVLALPIGILLHLWDDWGKAHPSPKNPPLWSEEEEARLVARLLQHQAEEDKKADNISPRA